MAATYLIGTNKIPAPCDALSTPWVRDVGFTETDDDNSALSGWVLNGITTSNTDVYKLYWNLTASEGTSTVSLYKDSEKSALVAQGTATTASGGTVDLAEQNTSGLSGTVTLAADKATDEEAENILACDAEISAVSGGARSDTNTKCFMSVRRGGLGTGSHWARAYRLLNNPAMPATDDIVDVFFWLKVGTDWVSRDDAGDEAVNWYPDICRLGCTTTSLVLKLYKYWHTSSDLSHRFCLRVGDSAGNTEDAKTVGTNPVIVPGAWHQIHWRTSGWQEYDDPGVVSEVWVDGHPVTWEQGDTDTTEATPRVTGSLPSSVYLGNSHNSTTTAIAPTAAMYFDDLVIVSAPDSDEQVDDYLSEMHSKVMPQADGSTKIMVQSTTPCTGTLAIGTATGVLPTTVTASAVTEHDGYVLWFDLGTLAANTTYYYKITLTDSTTAGTWTSAERTFKTDPGETAAHTALIFSGIQDNTYRGYTAGWAASNHSTVGLTIYNGDIGDHYTNLETWASDYELQRIGWGRNETLTKPLDSRSLCVLQPSNHDFMLDNGAAFWTMHPGSEYWHLPYGYADYYFLSMNWGPEYADGHVNQIAWLESVLPQGRRRFKIVVFEYTMFGNHPHKPGDAETYEGYTGRRSMIDRADLHAIFAANKVNLVVSGDVAIYNRWVSGGVTYVIGPPVNAVNTATYLNVPDFEQGYPNPSYADVPTDPALEPKYGSRRGCLGKGGYLALDVEDEYIDIKYYERKLGTCLDRFRLKPAARGAYPGTRDFV